MTLIQHFKSLAEANCPDYHFEYESERMMNERADDTPFPCVFFEEYTDGKVTQARYGWKEQTLVELSFMKLSEFQCDALERERIRQDIKDNAVFPFLSALQSSEIIDPIIDISILPEPPRFDSNCVSVLVRFYAIRRICL